MSIKHPGGFKFDFGSTVTVLTSVAGTDYGKNINSLGTFTGIVLDETDIKVKRDTKHISITMDGVDELQNAPDSGYDKDECECHKPEDDKDECEWYKYEDDKDDCEWCKSKDDKDDCEWCKPKDDKDDCEWHKPKNCKDHDDGKKHGHEIEVKKAEKFLVLSLTCPSYPFNPGQIVWINIEQIVAFTVVCRN